MKLLKLGLTLSAIASALSGCSTSTAKKEELQKVHRVAIIGLDLQQQKSISGGDLLAIATKTNGASHAAPAIGTESEHVTQVYRDVVNRLEKSTGWKVMSLEKLRETVAYKKFYKENTEGFQNRPMLNDRVVLFQPGGILDSWAVMTSKQERLIQLARDLELDAVVYAPVQVGLNNNSMFASLIGQGEFRPSANIVLTVLDARTGETIFSESVEGPKVKNGLKNTLGMADDTKINQLAREATLLSMDEAIAKLSQVK